ncbi:MAG: hypothetical protein WD847_19140 [Pirellulales bacterium]
MGGFVALLLPIAFVGTTADDEIAAVEEKVIANRLAIKRWHVRVSFRYPIGGSGQEVLMFTSYLDGDRQRADLRSLYAAHERFPGLTSDHYDGYLIWGDNEEIMYGTKQSANGAKRALEFVLPASDPTQTRDDKIRAADIRWIAWHPEGSQMSIPMTDVLRNPRFVDRQMEDDVLRAVRCKKISFRLDRAYDSTDNKHTIWVAPTMGYSILEYRLDYLDGAVPVRVRTETEVREWQDSGIWFPFASVYEKTVDGKVQTRQEETIEVFSINEALKPELFKASSLNVPIGTAVYIQPNPTRANRIWDGEKAVEVGLRSATPPEGAPRPRWLLVLNAFVLTLICVGCLARFFWRKKG